MESSTETANGIDFGEHLIDSSLINQISSDRSPLLEKEYLKKDRTQLEDLYECLMDAHQKYDFNDWENVPSMEFQARRKGTDEWIYLSDPIEDFMNT